MLDLFFRFNTISTGSVVERNYNLIPFKTIWEYISGINSVSKARVIQNILGNITIFIPYGMYLQVLLKNKAFGKSLLIVLSTSVSIEIIQFAFQLGATDIDDLILNICGGIIGIIGYKLLRELLREESKTKIAITLISFVAGIPVIFILDPLFLGFSETCSNI